MVRKKSGFSIIEIIVAIGIIVMLATITLTAVHEVRNRAKIQHCQNNLREIGMAFDMYDTFYSGKLPPTSSAASDDLRALFPVCAKSLSLFICISTGNQVNSRDDLADNAPGGRTGAIGHSYDYHSYLLYDKKGNHLDPPTVKTRSGADITGDVTWLVSDAVEAGLPLSLDTADNHYEVGANVLFADSHVEWIDPGRWDDKYKSGNTRRW